MKKQIIGVKMENNRTDWKFEVKFGKRKIGGLCPVCGKNINARADGGIDKSGRLMGSWSGCMSCGTSFPRGRGKNVEMIKQRS